MKRYGIIALLCALLMLTGCGETSSAAEEIRRQYGLIDTVQMEAEVTFHMSGEERCFTLQCDYTQDGANVTVTAPETVAGVTATLTGEDLTLTYDGESLSVGEIGGVNPISALPQMLRIIADGYLLEESGEKIEDIDCCRLLLDTTMGGEEVQCAVWIDEATYLPRYGEFSVNGETKVSVKMLAFSCTLREDTTEE